MRRKLHLSLYWCTTYHWAT